MGQQKINSLITSFTPAGDYLAILSSDGVVRIWNTSSGNLLAVWKNMDQDSTGSYSCMAGSFIGKKCKREKGTFVLALGTHSGNVLAINVLSGQRKWTSIGCHPGGATAFSFTNRGCTLYTAGTDGMVLELEAETGDLLGKVKASKKPISSLALSSDEKLLAVASDKIRVFRLKDKRLFWKFNADPAPVQCISVSSGGKAVISCGFGEKQLQVWKVDRGKQTETSNALSMQNPPVLLECKNSCKSEGLIVLSVSEKGVVYVWDLLSISENEFSPTKIVVKSAKTKADQQKSARKNQIPVIAAKLSDVKDREVSVVIAYGSPANLQFNLLDVTGSGGEVFMRAEDETLFSGAVTGNSQDSRDPEAKVNNIMDLSNHDIESTDAPIEKKVGKRKRPTSDPNGVGPGIHVAAHLEAKEDLDNDYDMNEPTMGEKLASLSLLDDATTRSSTKQELSSEIKLPSADSVHVLLKQGLHADDHSFLFDCLNTRDEKVIANTTSLLNPSDVLKLVNSLTSTIQSRGAVLVHAAPWLRSLLLQHASGIMSQESSLLILNSLYQFINSRISTFGSALQLSSCLDLHFAGMSDDKADEHSLLSPVIFEDIDSDEEPGEKESGDTMETDEENKEINTADALDDSVVDDMSD